VEYTGLKWVLKWAESGRDLDVSSRVEKAKVLAGIVRLYGIRFVVSQFFFFRAQYPHAAEHNVLLF
jgi:hypothetical protein